MDDNKTIKNLKEVLELMCYEGDLQRSATISKAIDLIIRQKEENAKLKEELDLVYEYHLEKGIAFDSRSYKEGLSGRCKWYHKRTKTIYLYHPITGISIPRDVEVGICSGTKERDECTCGGDESKCNFYPEKRKGWKR